MVPTFVDSASHANRHTLHLWPLCLCLFQSWWTLCVWVLYPIHFAPVTNDLNHIRVLLHPFTFHLGHWTSLASGPLPVQPLDGLIALGPLTPSAISMSRSPYACASHKPSPGALPEAPLFRVLSRVPATPAPHLWFQCKPQACLR